MTEYTGENAPVIVLDDYRRERPEHGLDQIEAINDTDYVVHDLDQLPECMQTIRSQAERAHYGTVFLWTVHSCREPGECILRLEEIERGMNE